MKEQLTNLQGMLIELICGAYSESDGKIKFAHIFEWRTPKDRSSETNDSYRYLCLLFWHDGKRIRVFKQRRWSVAKLEAPDTRIDGAGPWQLIGSADRGRELPGIASMFFDQHLSELEFFSPMLRKQPWSFAPSADLKKELLSAIPELEDERQQFKDFLKEQGLVVSDLSSISSRCIKSKVVTIWSLNASNAPAQPLYPSRNPK